MRSNGSVSHAGNSATWSRPRNCWRSSNSWPAIEPVGQATTSGVRLDMPARAAIEIGRATSGIASRAFGSPSARVRPGSSRSSAGNAFSGAVPTTRDVDVSA